MELAIIDLRAEHSKTNHWYRRHSQTLGCHLEVDPGHHPVQAYKRARTFRRSYCPEQLEVEIPTRVRATTKQ